MKGLDARSRILQTFATAVILAGVLTIQPDPLMPNKQYRVFNERGELKEVWRKDPLIKDQIRVFDKKGRIKKVIRRDPLFPDRWREEK